MMKKIYGNLLIVIMMSSALAGCIKYDTNPDVPWVEPKAVDMSGSGSLKVGFGDDALTTNSTYTWTLSETTMQIDVTVDLDQYVNGDDVIPGGAYEIGNFMLPTATVNEFAGIFVSELDETTFYAIEPDETVVEEMTSYNPGMWVDGEGYSGGWSTSAMFWQWYIWEGKLDKDGDEIGYDYSSEDYGNTTGLLVIGSNPANVAAQAGKTVTSKAKIVAGDVTYDWIVNVTFAGEISQKLEYEGMLVRGMGETAVETGSSYEMVADENGIELTFEVNLQEFIDSEDWQIGGFKADLAAINEYFGSDFEKTTITNFYPVEPDGTAGTAWTSYAPGQWVKADGTATDYSGGAMYWQWYLYEATDYDYDLEGNEGDFLLGANPGNAASLSGESVVSLGKFVVGDKTYNLKVTVNYGEGAVPAENFPDVPLTGAGYPLPYSAGVSGDNQFSWYTDEDGVYIFADIYTPKVIEDGAWEVMGFVINPEELQTAFGIEAGSWEISTFYPVEPDGTAGTAWSSYAPGQWVAADGTAANWSTGAMFWQYQVGGTYYDGHSTEGLLLIGTNPDNIADLGGESVVSKAKFFGKDWIVTVRYHSTYPTSGSGNVGPHTYTWALTETGVNIVANCSAALTDESWNWFGFPLNETYINDYYGINIDELSGTIESGQTTNGTDGFYPVSSEGARMEKWTSYSPGMWFGSDGNAWNWDYKSWGNFWQYYAVTTHDHNIPNLMLFGNFGDVTYNAPGTSGTSRAILNGTLQWNVTINIID